MTTLYNILGIVGTSGAMVALINVYGKLKAKRMDVALAERQQFIKELNEMRAEVNGLYHQLHGIIRENSELRSKVLDLERHVKHKSSKLEELKALVDEFNSNEENDAQEVFIRKVVELAA